MSNKNVPPPSQQRRLDRRALLTTAVTAPLAAPALAKADSAQRLLKFMLGAEPSSLDPVWTTANGTHDHGYLVFDTLYGLDDRYEVRPQMVAGHTVSDDGLTWRLVLRPGLRFHDGEKVLARDAVASIRRFAARDAFGAALLDATDVLDAPSDDTIRFRLNRPFPLLPNVLGKTGAPMPAIMPERLALTDPHRAVSDMIGSGPFRFIAAERVSGSLLSYHRFEGYVPRPDGDPSFTAGPKRVHLDRVEWHIIPEPQTAAHALMAGEMDWWSVVPPDLLAGLRTAPALDTRILDGAGAICIMRFNHLHPPFDNPAIRRALLGAVSQREFMQGVSGSDPDGWRDGVGVFPPGTPMANDAGMDLLNGPRDLAAVAQAIRSAGYQGEPVTLLAARNAEVGYGLAVIGADLLRKVGMNVEFLTMDFASLVQRRANMSPPAQGGWNIFFTALGSADTLDPASHLGIRGNGRKAWFGWPSAPKLEALRAAWLRTADPLEQRRLSVALQQQFWLDVPNIPLGALYLSSAYRRQLTGMRSGFPQFYNLRWA
jgi:peptide/nickel transport system substrate-binding protein